MTLNKSHQLFSPSRYTNRSGFSFKINVVISTSSTGKVPGFSVLSLAKALQSRIHQDLKIMKYINTSYSSQPRKHAFEVCALQN